MPPVSVLSLQQRDLLDFEPVLCASLTKVLDFAAHGVYFPKENFEEPWIWLPKERKLLIPLKRGEETLGVFIAQGVNSKEVKKILPVLPAVIELCLENMLLHKQNRIDPLTGLASERALLEKLSAETGLARSHSMPAPGEDEDPGIPLYRTSLGLILIKFESLSEIIRKHGHAFADSLLVGTAGALREVLPPECLAARAADDEFAILAPAASTGFCEKLSIAALKAIDSVSAICPVSGRAVRAGACLGIVLYPQHMNGADFRPNVDIARLLLQKGRLAASAARDRALAMPGLDRARIMDFAGILADGGVILDQTPMNRAITSLGRNVGARTGMRFSVWSDPTPPGERHSSAGNANYKGELELREVGETSSTAEILHLNDSTRQICAGDILTLSTAQDAPNPAKSAAEPQQDPATGLMGYNAFFERLTHEREHHPSFAMALLRAECAGSPPSNQDMALIAESCRAFMGNNDFGGRYGINSLIFFHCPDPAGEEFSPENLAKSFAGLCSRHEEKMELSVGIASWPFLQYHKSEIVECCRKALDLAILLPKPHVGIFGSLSINISADRLYSNGDIFGAIEEYKLALLADQQNALAWNSLGVCLAALSRQSEARRYFKEALRRNPGDPAAHYNLGALCQSINETRAAAANFRACIKSDPEHIFAHIRLGQLAEQGKRLQDARALYTKAMSLDSENQDAAHGRNLARRCLARVAVKQKKQSEARALLYETLTQNPKDAAAMQMLAELFLDNNESPEMAETLARQSINHQPGLKAGWITLARALRAQGKEEEAAAAETRIGA